MIVDTLFSLGDEVWYVGYLAGRPAYVVHDVISSVSFHTWGITPGFGHQLTFTTFETQATLYWPRGHNGTRNDNTPYHTEAAANDALKRALRCEQPREAEACIQ